MADEPDLDELDPAHAAKGHVTLGIAPGFNGWMKGCRCVECVTAREASIKQGAETRAARGAQNGRGSRKRQTAAQTARQDDANVAQVIAAGAGSSRGGARSATEGQILDVLSGLLVFLSVQFALWLADGDTNGAAPFSLTDKEGEDLAAPVARLLKDSQLNRKYGAAIASWSDLILVLYVAAGYYQRVRGPLRDKMARRNDRQPGPPSPQNGASPNGQIFQSPPPVGHVGVPDTL